MITMTTHGQPKVSGRLGNGLFQLASLTGIADKTFHELVMPEWKYAKYFNGPFPKNTPIDRDEVPLIREQKFEYDMDSIFTQIEKSATFDCDFKGYFQSYKYWQHCEKEVREMLTFKEEFKQKLRAELPTNIFDKPTIAVCIRRGDYVGNPHYYQIPISYYINCLCSFGDLKDYNLLFFSDDIEYCKHHFGCIPHAYFSEGHSDIEDLCLISMCDHQVLGNSTFHWWGAYLANSEYVFYPSEYFAGDLAKRASTVDFWPDKWVNTKVENQLDIPATFITVYKKDSNDREKNLKLLESFIEKNFGTAPYIYFFNEDKMHRTKAINEMTLMSKTEIIISIDTDILVPPMQLIMAVRMIQENEADIVYPYSGNFIKLNRASWYARLSKSLDTGILPKFPDTRMSVGGCVVFSRKKFIEAGMENENFISYGPEDKERFTRFMKLGLRVDRVNGNIYHMNHSIGKDSSAANPHYKKNCDEYQKVKNMSKEELIEYIKTWEWTK